jgi:hypothetical protein
MFHPAAAAVLSAVLAAASVPAIAKHKCPSPWECASVADVEVLEVPEGVVVKVTPTGKVILKDMRGG